MTNLDVIADVRKAGYKPRAVQIHLVETIDTGMLPMSGYGSVTCELAAHESLADLDLRPLRGLFVLTFDFTGNRDRHRHFAKLVADTEPSILVMHDTDISGHGMIYRRFAGDPPRTESFRL